MAKEDVWNMLREFSKKCERIKVPVVGAVFSKLAVANFRVVF
jgi:hypothetical protein